jgi:hypothetical protein
MRSSSRRALTLPVLALFAIAAAHAQTSPAKETLPAVSGIPGPLAWQHPPASWNIDADQKLTIISGGKTNWYVSAADAADRSDSSNRLLFKPASDFVLSAKVTVGSRSMWDAGGLVVYVNDSLWGKFGIEMTTENVPTIVSVVTRSVSDDNNSIAIPGGSAYLKVAKAGSGIFFYESEDGKNWKVIRAFTLGENLGVRAGFSAQSPVGDGCRVEFSHIQYKAGRINLWAGK